METVYDASEEKTNGTKLERLLIDGGTNVLRKLLHFACPPEELWVIVKKKEKKLKKKYRIPTEQWEILCPNSVPPDYKTFDISLLFPMIREFYQLSAPSTGWSEMPAEDNNSLEANLLRIRSFRNELFHRPSTGIAKVEFENRWKKIASSLTEIEIHLVRKRITKEMEELKNNPIDHDTKRRLEEQAEKWNKVQEQEKSSPRNCLPNKIQEKDVFGRNEEIEGIKKIAEGGEVSVVLITGGPGFGKTTVAKRVAYELAKPETKVTVLFCSLLTKKNFNEVAVEMINSCGTVSTQVPENPEQWLKDWSIQVLNQVTFVLDNADGVLESSDRESFISILSDMRRLSDEEVGFVITTRKIFGNPDLQPSEVRLGPLSAEQARDLLISRVQVHGYAQLHLSRPEYIAKDLCGCVPLALCIVGSLLADYSEETLIEILEKEPLAVLEDHQESVEKAIKTSFDLLKKPEQEVFILLSLFQGPFDKDAVQAVTKAEYSISRALPISILRSLKHRSLVEEPYFRRYQMHPLIQSYAKKIGFDRYNELLTKGRKLACVHFMLRLAKNADIYWSKDTCKNSLVSFQEDKNNFEHFLQIYAQGREEKDAEIVKDCELFLDSFPYKCMYLERCLHPRSYTEILERLLETFDSESQPVYVVDLLCLLGNEYRKKKGKEGKKKYDEVMVEAQKIHLKNPAAFESKPLSELHFHNSNARFLKGNKQKEEECTKALKICKDKYEQLHDHPETAATLIFSGIVSKLCGKFDEAIDRSKKALELFQTKLGKHYMTALTLKITGDLYASLDEKYEVDGPECYKAALKMFDDLGMGENKESILVRKNLGTSHMKSENFDEAMKLFSEAEQIAKRELEEEHHWKVLVETSLALLLEKMNNVEGAIDKMHKGLEMGKSMNLPVNMMGGEEMIKFLNRYPGKFPETELPSK